MCLVNKAIVRQGNFMIIIMNMGVHVGVSSRSFGLGWKGRGNFTNYVPLSIAKSIFWDGRGIAWFSVS